MKQVYRKFYRSFYMNTGGFIPSSPLHQNLYPGDFFQIKNGEILLLGNIFQAAIINREDVRLEYGIKLNSSTWNFNDGLSKPYSGRGSGHGPIEGNFEYSRQLLAFSDKGSFLFHGNNPELVKIQNWSELQQQLIIKFTQTVYSFRELYIVTDSVTTDSWTLAIAGAEKAELEIATDTENYGLVDIFGHHTAKTIQSKDIEFYHKENRRKPVFFKAKKLVVQDERRETFISDLITKYASRDSWAEEFYSHDFHFDRTHLSTVTARTHTDLLDMMQAGELNPNTALLYFRWTDATLDDVEKLFDTYAY